MASQSRDDAIELLDGHTRRTIRGQVNQAMNARGLEPFQISGQRRLEGLLVFPLRMTARATALARSMPKRNCV